MPKTENSKYTPAKVEQLRQSLHDYFQDPENLFFESWLATTDIPTRAQVMRLCQQFPAFAQEYERCKLVQAARLLEGATRTSFQGNRAFYTVNPQIAKFVLQCGHEAFKPQAGLEVTERPDPEAEALEAIRERLPEDPGQAREWLEKLASSKGDTDGAKAVRGAADKLLGVQQLLDECADTSSAICDL